MKPAPDFGYIHKRDNLKSSPTLMYKTVYFKPIFPHLLLIPSVNTALVSCRFYCLYLLLTEKVVHLE